MALPHKEIALAKGLGMTVVVTDHHEVPVEEERQVLPPADVVVDPKQEGETYPFREICGAMVAYKLVEKLYEASGVPREEWRELLEFAAIATVGDVMRLQDEKQDPGKIRAEADGPHQEPGTEKTGGEDGA